MKKLSILLLITAAAAILFSSCNKEYAEPTIAFTPDVLSHYVDFADETTFDVAFDVKFDAEAGINSIEIWKNITFADGTETSVSLTAPTGYDGLTSFDYAFAATNVATDFDGVEEIIYEFIVTDASETPQSTKKEYTIINVIPEVYTVTFNVVDEADAAIADAVVTFNGVTNAAGEYTFEAEAGTYEYTVAKEGFDDVTVTDYVLGEADATISVTLVEELPVEWTGPIALALEGQESWASYNDVAVTIYESETIGFAFTATTATTVTVTPTTNCAGWVLVDDITALTTEGALEAAYAAGGTPLDTYNLPYDQHKAFETLYFVSKIGDNYLLVEYIAGHRDASTGNIVVFQYKD